MKYKRVILKISGEALSGENGAIYSHDFIERVVDEVIKAVKNGTEIGIVIGGGNIWRGRTGAMVSMNAVTADHMGMLATLINALALQDSIERKGTATRVMCAVEMRAFGELYIRRRAVRHLEKGRVVIFACGTGNPHFTTDTAAALRAAEMEADVILLAKNVDGVYTADPHKDKTAIKIDDITYEEAIIKNLKVMDSTAFTMCRDNNIPIIVFGLSDPENITKVLLGEKLGTLVHS